MKGRVRRQLCPVCSRLAVSEVINHLRSTATVIEASYLCPAEHQWTTHWHVGEKESISG